MINPKSTKSQSSVLKTGSTKAAFAKSYDFPVPNENGPYTLGRSTNNVFDLGLNGGLNSSGFVSIGSSERLTQSAETMAIQSKDDELRIANNPLKLRKGSK